MQTTSTDPTILFVCLVLLIIGGALLNLVYLLDQLAKIVAAAKRKHGRK